MATFDLDQAMEVLQRTPGALSELLRGLDGAWISANEGPGSFSPFDVVGHLIDGEETDWIPRARIIMTCAADPVFEPYARFRHKVRNEGRSRDDRPVRRLPAGGHRPAGFELGSMGHLV
jgi:hypothetical protein